MTLTPGINEIRPATVRVRGLVRRTPLLAARPTKEQPQAVRDLLLKLEALQVTGSLKPHGAVNALLALTLARCSAVTSLVTAAVTWHHGAASP